MSTLGEKDFTRKPGLRHKYSQPGLLLLNDVCGGIWRLCFRKRLFMEHEREIENDVYEGIHYIREYNKIISGRTRDGGSPWLLCPVGTVYTAVGAVNTPASALLIPPQHLLPMKEDYSRSSPS